MLYLVPESRSLKKKCRVFLVFQKIILLKHLNKGKFKKRSELNELKLIGVELTVRVSCQSHEHKLLNLSIFSNTTYMHALHAYSAGKPICRHLTFICTKHVLKVHVYY